MKYVIKDDYEKWENQIIQDLYDKKHKRTELFPTNNSVSYVKQSKYIILADFNNIFLKVSKKDSVIDSYPEKTKIKLFHIGKNKLDLVTSGYAKDDEAYKHPALDFGGLTNYWQKPHKKDKTYGNIEIFKDTPLSSVTKDLYSQWKELMKKNRFVGGINEGLKLWLQSVQKIMKTNDSVTVRIVKLSPNHRILAKQNFINKKYGKYLIKTYSNDPLKFAKIVNNGNNFVAISEKFVNPNINSNNIHNEYQSYT